MTYWETEYRYDTPGKRADELRREQEQMRDEYHRMEERVAELEDERDRLREALRGLVELIENDAFYEADPPYDNEPMQLKDARTALQEAGE